MGTAASWPAGVPCIFWEHYFDWGEKVRAAIDTLVTVRKRNGVLADSKLDILCAEADMYVARIDNKCVPASWAKGPGRACMRRVFTSVMCSYVMYRIHACAPVFTSMPCFRETL